MATSWQLTVDCADPGRLVEFWCAALGYVPEPAPAGWASWLEYWRAAGIPDEDLEGAEDGSGAVVDPHGVLPRIWFQQVPEGKTIKNRLHLDVAAGGGRSVPSETRRARVEAEAERLVGVGATLVRTLAEPGLDHVAVAMTDPEGNEFDIN
jgi:hypothetical protein